ncbi:type II secretion system F family protein [Pseudoalteromonas shioyasakiensis]|uniref:Type II secretion system F family protein n=1 Tax=Pseudoalteromonas shioyasakiensis TaxID=1190813 RepID=A0ABT6U5T3_9GAMM|nr:MULTISPECIES: type II secretion system F family protein [Pseudoalteromonas]MBC7010653.1 type II secretion system F family protein [Pseudoalteromonas sp. BZK2]MDI4671548.1 type II secretion system F family protein [Pseudoalteromonas shioyasakiensis]MDI4674163.1 type II secretion system F family protein [Pseudoalteromonas shioyasakiensis]MDI4688441.1 type II secretion system F family protein [Pseudoalteromonas shioyasakiensis]MDI4707053.1 type II secretion system F family protein [Pseudoalter
MMIDYFLSIGAFILGIAGILILYLVRKPATPSKRNIEEDILFQQDTLTQSIKVIGIPSSRLWIIFFTALISLLVWFGLDAIFPDARTSKLIISLIIFVGINILIIDLGQFFLNRFETQFIEYIETIHTCLQTGLSLQQSLEFAQNYAGKSIKKQTYSLMQKLQLSADINGALAPLLNRYSCESVRLFSQCVITHYETHCDLTDMFKSVTQILSRRARDKQQIRSKLSGTKYAAVFSGILPYILVPLFNYKDPTWFDPLLSHPNGVVFLTVAFLCQLFGLIWLRVSLKVKI